ncbi:glycosyltransferase family 2 protein [Microbacterium rhizomatis]|uniref:Glycosyltransferase family 2 protein n=1 Tax=Microbacterium rhizomatis TaxID=1631477 RepID=A0A5J5J730_9MICO|nr:glycosyltransferase family 2 protein [Microbacterium rhizomatis]KAA9111249.1 glycosyltransferase family 2 protein [Microbacterium rhizomatis]
MAAARVGIVVRTKNRPDFVARALADISAQTFVEWEIVIAHDAGNRDELDAVVAAADLGARVSIEEVPRPGGRCAAANAGIRATSAPLIVLHDDDDLWEREFLAETVAWIDAHPDAAGVVASTAVVYEEKRGTRWVETARLPFWKEMTRMSLSEMLEVNRAVPISFLYRRSVHDDVGMYDESLDAVEDWELLLRILPRYEIGYIDGPPLALWMQRPDAEGIDANSMFALQHQHIDDDAKVRDRELARWIADNGVGLPLYLASLEQRLAHRIDEGLARQEDRIRFEIDAHQPVWSRLRRMRRRLRKDR